MTRLLPLIVVAMLVGGPAAAFGPTIDMPTLSFPDKSGVVSSQNCTPDVTKNVTCE